MIVGNSSSDSSLSSQTQFSSTRNISDRHMYEVCCLSRDVSLLWVCRFSCAHLCLCATGVFAFGLFATDIFVNAGQVVTGGLSPYFLSVCKPNYTGTECRFNHQFIVNGNICTGNPVVVENARRSFPSKDASLSVYSAVYLTVSSMCLIANRVVFSLLWTFHKLKLKELLLLLSPANKT